MIVPNNRINGIQSNRPIKRCCQRTVHNTKRRSFSPEDPATAIVPCIGQKRKSATWCDLN